MLKRRLNNCLIQLSLRGVGCSKRFTIQKAYDA